MYVYVYVYMCMWHYYGRVALFASRDLKAGEELTFDYQSNQKTFNKDWAHT
jgi:hypothetical protein